MEYSFDASTAFKLSGEIAVPSNLPFSATFDSSNMIAGQNVSIASQVIVTSGGTNTCDDHNADAADHQRNDHGSVEQRRIHGV
jgi:hypothetical protein